MPSSDPSRVEDVIMKHAHAIEAYVSGDYDGEEGHWGVGGIAQEIRAAITEAVAAPDAEALDAEFAAIVHTDRRDDFAKAALGGLIVANAHLALPYTVIAREAYLVADEMLAAREKATT